MAIDSNFMIPLLYAGWFDRMPDKAGMDYWIEQSGQAQSSIETFVDISERFRDSDEARALYPGLAGTETMEMSDATAFVNQVYSVLFDREADTPGLQYWSQQLVERVAHDQPIGHMIVDLIAAAGEGDIDVLARKSAAARAFAESAGEAQVATDPVAKGLLDLAGTLDGTDAAADLGELIAGRLSDGMPADLDIRHPDNTPQLTDFFDADWYNQNVIQEMTPKWPGDPLTHYIQLGAPAGFAPNEALTAFDGEAYMQTSLLARTLVEAGRVGSAMDAWLRIGLPRGESAVNANGDALNPYGVNLVTDTVPARIGTRLDLLANDDLAGLEGVEVSSPDIGVEQGLALSPDGLLSILPGATPGTYSYVVTLPGGGAETADVEVTTTTPVAEIRQLGTVVEDSGSPLIFELILNAPYEAPVSVDALPMGGSADAETDIELPESLTVVFEPGQTHTTIRVPVISDTEEESNETVGLLIVPTEPTPDGYLEAAIGADRHAIAVIADDDGTETPTDDSPEGDDSDLPAPASLWSVDVELEDPFMVDVAAFRIDLAAQGAIDNWMSVIQAHPDAGPLTIDIDILRETGGVANAKVQHSYEFFESADGELVAHTNLAAALQRGGDATVEINVDYTDLETRLLRWDEDDRAMLEATMTHELGHHLGVFPSGDRLTTLWESYIEDTADGRVFTGPNAVAANGGDPIPLAPDSPHLLDDAIDSIMDSTYSGAEALSAIDIGIMADLGYTTELSDPMLL